MQLQSENKNIAQFIGWTFILLFVGSGIFFFRMEISDIVLKDLDMPALALMLDPRAERAVEVGNYYFNVYGDGVYDLKRADFYFSRALELDPNVSDAWHQRARIDFLNGDFDGALEKINTQIDIHGDGLMSSFYIRGLVHGFRGEFDEAERDFLAFLQWDTKNWAAHNDLAWIYFQKGDFEDALAVSEDGLQYSEDNPWLLSMKGISLLNLEKNKEAVAVLTKALEKAEVLTPEHWARAYPGNDPRVAQSGLEEMIKTIRFNLDAAVNK